MVHYIAYLYIYTKHTIHTYLPSYLPTYMHTYMHTYTHTQYSMFNFIRYV